MTFKQKKKIGLALGSGAARGLAHIGVLKVLEREGLSVDCISGSSIGAVIGALYASGVPVTQMEEVACGVNWAQLARLIDPILPTSGLIDGRKVSAFFNELLPARTFEELSIPLAVTATDVESGEALTIRRGDLHEALRAAISFPGIFTPVAFDGRFLIDGGVSNPVPIDIVRELGAEVTVGVCTIPLVDKRSTETYFPRPKEDVPTGKIKSWFTAHSLEEKLRELWPRGNNNGNAIRRPPNIFRIFAQSVVIMENEIATLRLGQNHIDLLIRPQLGDITLLEFNKAREAIKAGEQAALAQIEQLRTLSGCD